MGTKLSQLTEATDFNNTDIMHLRTTGGIDKKITGLNIVNGFQDILSKSANYTIIDTDRHPIILMTTSTTDKTVILPTLADNLGKRIRLIKIDSGAGKAILDGEGTETINGFTTWEISKQWGYIDVIGTSMTWIILDMNGYPQIVAKSANYIILDNDYVSVIDMTAGATNKTATLPTAADNLNREITLVKVDSGVGKAILDGEGAETINGTLTWEITEQWGRVKVKSDGSNWIVLEQWGCVYEEKSTTTGSQVNPSTGVWHNLDTFKLLAVPAGVYVVEYSVAAKAYKETATTKMDIFCTLASNGAAETDKDFTVMGQLKGYGAYDHPEIIHTFFRRKKVALASAQSFYLNTMTNESNTVYIYNMNSTCTAIIRATRIG